jgi:hypothetical protein
MVFHHKQYQWRQINEKSESLKEDSAAWRKKNKYYKNRSLDVRLTEQFSLVEKLKESDLNMFYSIF